MSYRSAFADLPERGPRLPAGPWPAGYDEVMEFDTFDSGFSGWQDHTEYVAGSTTRAYPPIGISSERTAFNSRHALVLGTSSARADTVDKGGSCVSFKRGDRRFDSGFVAVFFYWTLRTLDEKASPNRFKFDIDTQSRDDTTRMYGSLALRRWIGTAPDAFAPRWSLRDYDNPDTYIDIPDAGIPTNPTATPGVGDVMGWNENKAGFSWAGLVMSYDTNGYHRVFTGTRWHDVVGLADAYEKPQARNDTVGSTSFAIGDNIGASIFNRSAADDGPAKLFLGSVVKLHYPAGTEFPS